jgi:16S rRNA (cytosine967-C5)-methyltransferase
VFLDRIPAHAAVNEAVEQAVRQRHKRKSGMVNGVLRTVRREVSDLISGRPPAAPDVIPVRPDAYRKADRAVFPDPQADPAGYLAAAYSLPRLLASRWVKQQGSLEAAIELAAHANVRAPIILRVNRIRADVQAVLDSLSADGVEAQPHENGHSVVVAGQDSMLSVAAFREGLVQVQDASATAVVLAAEPRPGMNVLDFCAAPGTKTTHLAERMQNQGAIVAMDVAGKLGRVASNCRRLGVTIVTTHPADDLASLPQESFDLVLVDAPCTNTGVLARRAEARWRFDEAALRRAVRDQLMLLKTAANYVKPGGMLVYSTCSIEPEECGEVVRSFAREDARAELADEKLSLPAGAADPARWHDGGYYALLRR